jgi:hypothetical protein
MKLVNESLEEFQLNETYESSKELNKITEYILTHIGEINKPCTFKELFRDQNLSLFPLTQKFLQSDMQIVMDNNIPWPMLAIPPYEQEDLQKYPYLNNISAGTIIIGENNKDALLHELQHAFDYFRSETRMASDKRYNKFNRLYKDKQISFFDEIQNRQYIRLKAEQSAFFSECFSLTKKLIQTMHADIKNIKTAFNIFKMYFPLWNLLPEKDQKNLTRKFWQHWQKLIDENI